MGRRWIIKEANAERGRERETAKAQKLQVRPRLLKRE